MTESRSTSQPVVAVVGGGITGLAAAHRLGELGGVRVELFERSPRTGGLVHTSCQNGFLIEHGADAFITNKPAAIELCNRLGLQSEIVSTDDRYRRTLVLARGRPEPVPGGLQLLMPTQSDSIRASSLLSAEGIERVLREPEIAAAPELRDESLASFVRRRFGDEWFDRIAQPMVGGIYTADPERLSLLATLPRFLEMEQAHGSLFAAAAQQPPVDSSGARYGLFVTLRDGMNTLFERLRTAVAEGGTVHCGREIRSVHSTPSGCRVIDAAGAESQFDAVLLALPAWAAADVLTSDDGNLASELNGIEYASSAIVVTAHRLSDIRHDMEAFGLVVPAVESRRILAVSFASRKFPGRAPDGCILLRTFIGGAMQPELLQQSDTELLTTTREELGDIFGVAGEPIFEQVVRYHRAMPQYHLGHMDRVRQIRELVRTHDRLELAGNAYEGVGLPDAVRSGEQAAERVHEVLATSNS